MKPINSLISALIIMQSLSLVALDKEPWAEYEVQLQREDSSSLAYLELLDRALMSYPEAAPLWLERGRFYSDSSLPEQAIESALKALKFQVLDYTAAWQLLIGNYSSLGLYHEALYYVRLYSETFPFDERARSELLWYMFKTMQIVDGLVLGEEALLEFPYSIEIHSLLAILYGASYDYDKANAFYEQALSLAQAQNNIESQLLTLYNRYLLEVMFRRFSAAESHLNQALALNGDDPELLRLLATLEYGRMNYQESVKAYQESSRFAASSNDRTPLVHRGLVELHITFGHLDEAARLLSQIDRNPSTNWMLRRGITPTIFEQSIAHLHLKLWQARLNDAQTQIVVSWRGWLTNFGMRLFARFQIIYHSQKVRFLSLVAGDEQFSHNNFVEAYRYFRQAVSGNPWLYNELIARSSALEQKTNPDSVVSYNVEMALRKKRPQQLILSYNELDSLYEREQLSRVLAQLINLENNSKTMNPQWRYELYALNPYALRRKGMGFKVIIDSAEPSKEQIKALHRVQIFPDGESPYQLILNLRSSPPSVTLLHHNTLKWSISLAPWTQESGLPALAYHLQGIVFATAL